MNGRRSGEVGPNFLVAVGAFFFRSRGRAGMLGLHRVLRGPPGRQPAAERPRLPSLLSKKLRHTGARGLLGSGAVGDDLPIRRHALEVLQDLWYRPRGLDRPNDGFGRDSNRTGNSMADRRIDERTGHIDGDRFAGVELRLR